MADWEPGLVRGGDDAATLMVWTGPDGTARFRLRVISPDLPLRVATARLCEILQVALADDTEAQLDGVDAAMRVQLRATGEGGIGRGWLNAPEDHVASSMRWMAAEAIRFLTH
jgi:hypothetical protein